jgi:hypothetical protein
LRFAVVAVAGAGDCVMLNLIVNIIITQTSGAAKWAGESTPDLRFFPRKRWLPFYLFAFLLLVMLSSLLLLLLLFVHTQKRKVVLCVMLHT